MNERLNTQDLVDLLAAKHGMDKKDADGFVKEFFLLIEQTLESDKYVKIKGLGTFKLIDVNSRESVNVNTGERFEIQGHTKVSFTPDATLRDIVNKPFAHFETVILNEGTVLEDTPLEDQEDDAQEINVKEIEEIEELPPVSEQILSKAPIENKSKSTVAYLISIIIIVLLLCGGVIFSLYYPDIFSSADKIETTASPVVQPTEEDKTSLDTVAAKDTIPPIKPVVKSESPINQPTERVQKENIKEVTSKLTTPVKPDSVNYTITGTKTTYTMKPGETLTRVSLQFYGTKELWPYIVKHNLGIISNPNHVPSGTTLKIPELTKKN